MCVDLSDANARAWLPSFASAWRSASNANRLQSRNVLCKFPLTAGISVPRPPSQPACARRPRLFCVVRHYPTVSRKQKSHKPRPYEPRLTWI